MLRTGGLGGARAQRASGVDVVTVAPITLEYLNLRAKLFLLHIPHRGTAPWLTNLIASQVDTSFTGSTVVLPDVRAGRLHSRSVRRMPRR